MQDTLETSLFARNTLPACYGPANRYPTPPAAVTSFAITLAISRTHHGIPQVLLRLRRNRTCSIACANPLLRFEFGFEFDILFGLDTLQAYQFFVFAQADQGDTLGISSERGNLTGVCAYQGSTV